MMTSKHLRFALFGALLGLLVALVPGCQKKCAADTCAGCCGADNKCILATDATQCGLAGSACAACGEGQTCDNGSCMTPGNGGEDGGAVDAGPPPCQNDFECPAGKICAATGECVTGPTCRADSDCQVLDPNDRCYRYGQQCTCDSSATGGGTCRLRKGPCQECTADSECGNDVVIFGPPDGIGMGRCKALPNDMTGKKYCLYQRVGQCACGTVDDGTGFCKPQSNSCDQVGCNVDKDCSSGSVCSVNRPDAGAGSCGGVCVPRCRWDFSIKDNVAPGCPPGTVCWVDSANLDPNSIYYGSGRCKPPCADNADCQQSAGNPFGGTNLKCAAEKLPDGTESPKRCRANGVCMDSLECIPLLNLPDTQPYIGYCDRGTFTCERDCRTGLDPVTGNPYKDCRSPFACSVDAGLNYCRLETCTEQGGAVIACAQGEYCCGDDKNFDGVADPCPPKSQQDPAGCYKAPAPPFCTQCGASVDWTQGVDPVDQAIADDECARAMRPSWATCPSDGGYSPNCSPLRAKCMYAGNRGMSPGIAVCMVPSVNDIGTVSLRYGPMPKALIACPANYSVNYVRPQPNPSQDIGYCQTNADCSILPDGGVGDAGVCDFDSTLRKPDGGLFKACRCPAKSGAANCPNGESPAGLIQSFCKDATVGATSFCITTAVCEPPRGSVYQPADGGFGCGL